MLQYRLSQKVFLLRVEVRREAALPPRPNLWLVLPSLAPVPNDLRAWSTGLRSRLVLRQDSQATRTNHRAPVRSCQVPQDSPQVVEQVPMEWALDLYLIPWPVSPSPVPLPSDLRAWSAILRSRLVLRQDSQAMRMSHRAPARLSQDYPYPSWKAQGWKEAVVQALQLKQRENRARSRAMQTA